MTLWTVERDRDRSTFVDAGRRQVWWRGIAPRPKLLQMFPLAGNSSPRGRIDDIRYTIGAGQTRTRLSNGSLPVSLSLGDAVPSNIKVT